MLRCVQHTSVEQTPATEMFFAKAILTALAFVAVSSATPTPSAAVKPAPLGAPTITLCSGGISPPTGCVIIPIVSDQCINLVNGLTFLNKEISTVMVPGGIVCTFFENFGCLSVNNRDVVVLQGGTWSMSSANGLAGTQDFNDLTSSISCSPL
ncbi:hypothetical protein DFH09DRAFT_366282 [Mycena vulgaris]|nr:hypothetical protein DFH09DRAFT_366282 [Mycena vulgaris]